MCPFTQAKAISCFNPRSPCGERPGGLVEVILNHVSTHAPLAGSDEPLFSCLFTVNVFQPTLPLRGATNAQIIAIPMMFSFNPRSPCGERPFIWATSSPIPCFNPRSPCGERQGEPPNA